MGSFSRFRDVVGRLDRADRILVSVPLVFGATYTMGAWTFETQTFGVAAAALAATGFIGYGLVSVSPPSE